MVVRIRRRISPKSRRGVRRASARSRVVRWNATPTGLASAARAASCISGRQRSREGNGLRTPTGFGVSSLGRWRCFSSAT
eukprot:11207263-Lingulodinium_polyedra.AAC.1